MILLIEYIFAIMIVMLFLVGSVLLSLRLRIREKMDWQPEEQVQLELIDDQPKRGFPRALRRERKQVLL